MWLGTLSAPVAEQVIAGRPYLQPTDLSAPAVPGVSDSHVQLWMQLSRVCVTPIFTTASDNTRVPVTPNVCVRSEQVDLNDRRDYAGFVDMFGRPTADRVVSGMPYPSVDNSLRRAGVGPGQLKKYEGQICATPYPIRFNGIDWAFATPQDGIAVNHTGDYGKYTLTVPAGVAGGAGSWASVAEQEASIAENAAINSFHIDAPTVDAHIHGPWSGSVGVTLPPDPTDVGSGYVDTAIHYSDLTGPMLYANAGIAIGSDGRLTVAEQDLSPTSALKLAARWIDGIRNAAVRLATQAEKILRAGLGLGGQATCNPDITGQTLSGGAQFDVSGEMLDNGFNFTPRLNHCVTRASNSAAIPLTWKLIEPTESQYRWEQADAMLDWAAKNNLRTSAGPLLDFSGYGLPDWLMSWEGDLPSLSYWLRAVHDLNLAEAPKSPWTKWPSQRTYWTGMGWSSP